MRQQISSLVLLLLISHAYLISAQQYVTSSECNNCSCTCKLPVATDKTQQTASSKDCSCSCSCKYPTNTNGGNTNGGNTNGGTTNGGSNNQPKTYDGLPSGKLHSIAYVNTMTSYWGESILDSFGLNSCYDIIILTFWLSTTGPRDAVLYYKNIASYQNDNKLGSSSLEIQKYIQQEFKKKGKKLMISAFGATNNPTNQDPTQVAIDFANFVNALPYIDGVDIDYEDNAEIATEKGVNWVITFTKVLREKLNNKDLIVAHAPQAPYFSKETYSSGGYFRIHKEVGHLINWYNIQYYNQGVNSYDNYNQLFVESGINCKSTSVKEIHEKAGVPLNKIVIGKPVTTQDVGNTGYLFPKTFGAFCKKARMELKYDLPGFFIWQFKSDINCAFKNSFMQGYSM